VSSSALRRLIAANIDCERLEALATPLHVIACYLMTGPLRR
jgi:hypothetical protein